MHHLPMPYQRELYNRLISRRVRKIGVLGKSYHAGRRGIPVDAGPTTKIYAAWCAGQDSRRNP